MSHSHNPVHRWRIEACGAVTPIGTSAWQSAASWVGQQKRLRKQVFPEVSTLPITTSSCPEITAGQTGLARLAALLGAALADLLVNSPPHTAQPTCIALGLPNWVGATHMAAPLWQQTLQALVAWGHNNTAQAWQALPVHYAFGGSSAGIAALATLNQHLPADKAQPALLLGVDSLLDQDCLQHAYAEHALLTEATPEGYIASEGAGALWLQPVPSLYADTEHKLVLHPPALAQSHFPHRQDKQEPDHKALSQALKKAMANAHWSGPNVGHSISDFDGSAWRALLQANALRHAGEDLSPSAWEPAAALGQIGAASAVVHMALAAQRLRCDKSAPNTILCWELEPGTATAAVALERTLRSD
jgi:hypothetical protein